MNQEEWTKRLYDRLANYEEVAPDNLWADIEGAIEQQSPKPRSRVVPLWGKRIAVAAAFLGVVMCNGYLIWKVSQDEEALTVERPLVEHINTPKQGVPLTIDEYAPIPMKPQTSLAQMVIPEPEHQEEASTPMVSHEPEVVAETQESPEKKVSKETINQIPSQEEVLRKLDEKIAEASHPRRRIGFGLYAQNSFGSQMSMNGVRMNPAMADNYNYDKYLPPSTRGDDNDPIYLSNIQERKKFYQPISIGLTTNIPISSKLSLTTGVVYTRLRSDFVSVVSGYPLEKKQTLQYVGIPLSIQYQLFDYKGLKAYVSAGGQADYNVKARQTTEGVSHEISRDRWQFSVQGAVGFQYDILPEVGVYVEPGVKRYFDNGSTVHNFFKDKPTNFNLQVGIRLNVGR